MFDEIYDEFERTQIAFEHAKGYSHELYRAGKGSDRLRYELDDESGYAANMDDSWANDAQ